MKRLLCIGCILLLGWAAAGPAAAQNGPESARELIQDKIGEVLRILERPEPDEAQKREQIETIVDPVFNYDLMAKLALGPRHWPKLSVDQQETFTRRFVRRLKSSYFDKISMYSGDAEAEFTYKPIREKNGKVHVPMEVQTRNNKIDIVYKFYRAGTAWKIYDVEVNGVSIIQSYRAQFDQVLARGTVQELLESLKPAGDSQ